MIRNRLIEVTAVLALLAAGPTAASETGFAAEFAFHGSYTLLPLGPDRVALTYETFSFHIGGAQAGPLAGSSAHCLGLLTATAGIHEQEVGHCRAVNADGESFSIGLRAEEGRLGDRASGTITLGGGTGSLVGLAGEGRFERVSRRTPRDGLIQGVVTLTGSWRLP